MPSRARNIIRDERGQAAVELGLLFPVIMLVLVMIFQFGVTYYRWNNATQLASQGARLAAVDSVGSGPTLQSYIAAQASSGTPVVSVLRPSGAGVGSPVMVCVKTDYDFDVPLLGELIKTVNGGSTKMILRGRATMRSEAPASNVSYTVGSSCP